MQPAQKPAMTRAQKLKWYAEQLISDATSEEKVGSNETAVAHYLQAADILLLLAKVEANYTAWKYYADTASMCQQRARRLIALAPKDGASPAPR